MSEAKKLINELLVEIFNRILAIEEEALRQAGVPLSMTEIHVLEAVENVPEPSMTAIAAKLGITVGSLTTSVATLANKGYVLRRRPDVDRRKVLVELTPAAHRTLEIHAKFHAGMIDSIFEDLKVEEDEVLLASLRRVAAYFRK
ncbi:MAG: MarR family winged helix-turn-helix transcriptional regulator [Candidatus Izemoplasmatales bacterium]